MAPPGRIPTVQYCRALLRRNQGLWDFSMSDPAALAAQLVKKVLCTAAADDRSTLSDEELKQLKNFSRQAEAHMLLIAEETLAYLAKRDAQVRFVALQLCAALWPRSAPFRRALLDRLVPEFVQLVGGEPETHPLPLPESWAEQLSRRALELIESWDASHGQLCGYRGLALARRYLRAVVSGGDGGRRGGAGVGSEAANSSAAGHGHVAVQSAQRCLRLYEEIRAVAEASLADMRRGASNMEACLRILAPSLEEGLEEAWAAKRSDAAREGAQAHRATMEPFERLAAARGSTNGKGGEAGEEEVSFDGGVASSESLGVGALGRSVEFSLSAHEQPHSEHGGGAVLDALRDAYTEARNAFEPRLISWSGCVL